jgi:hypothetical protein
MSQSEIPTELLSCPIDCVNRAKPSGIRLFGLTLDPIEFTMHLALLALLAVPASKRSIAENFTWQEAIGWFGAMAAGSAVLRMAPTDRLNAYSKILVK